MNSRQHVSESSRHNTALSQPRWEPLRLPLLPQINREEQHTDRPYINYGYTQHEVQALIQEMPENGADAAHLNVVHQPCRIPLLGAVTYHTWDAKWTPNRSQHISGPSSEDSTPVRRYKVHSVPSVPVALSPRSSCAFAEHIRSSRSPPGGHTGIHPQASPRFERQLTSLLVPMLPTPVCPPSPRPCGTLPRCVLASGCTGP